VVERPQPTEDAPQHLCLDKGYDNPPGEAAAARFGYTPHIRRIGEEKLDEQREKKHPARRWVVERTFAWLGQWRRLAKDYEQSPRSTEAFMQIAMIVLMLNRLDP